jgi:type IV pilus assembly protein PilC
MPQFSYKARDESGKTIRGTREAEGPDQLASALREKNFYLITASRKKRPSASFGFRKIKRQDIIDFSYQLATILRSGIPILSGLKDLAAQSKGTRFGKILEGVTDDLKGGDLFHESLYKYPQAFGETYISMIKAGEASGNLEGVLHELANFLDWQQDLSSEIQKASIYPTVVIIAVGMLILFVFTFVFPRIYPVLLALNVPLPLSTRVLVEVSKFCQYYWYFILISTFGGIAGIYLISRLDRGRTIIDKLKLRVPVIGEFIRKIALSRLAHHLSLLLEAGVGIIQSLTLVEKVVGNQIIAEAVEMAKDQVEAGSTLSEALRKKKEFDPMFIRMVCIGETSGTLSEGLAKISDYYDREIPRAVKKIFSALEPLIIVFLALIVGIVVLSIYLPIYQGIGMIGR